MGKGSSAPTNQTVTQTNIPEEFMPYFERLMGRVEEQSLQPYQAYGGERLAAPGADTLASRDLTRGIAGSGIAGLGAAQATAQGNIDLARQLGQYGPGTFSQYGGFKATEVSPFTDFSAGRADPYAGFSAGQAAPFSDFAESGFKEFQFGPAGEFTGSSVGQYMDPYMQNVLDVEKRRAAEDYDIARAGRNARAVQAGAFGGSRQAVQEGLAERDLLERQGAIQSRGLSTAYGDAQRMFEADRAARMGVEAAQAGEAGRFQGAGAGEAARVQAARAAELARTQGIGVDEAARVQAAQAAELARTQGIGIGEDARVQAARAAELARTQGISVDEASRIQAAQAAELGRVQTGTEASRQFGASQGLAALDAAGRAGQQLTNLGQEARAAEIQNAQLLEAIGRSQQGEAQAGLDIGYQDFLRQQGYPEEQLGFYSDILRGLPVANAGTTTETGSVYTNPLQQALGAGLSGLSLYRAFQ